MEKIVKEVLNHLFEVKIKLEKANFHEIDRNINRLENKLNALGYSYHSPLGEPFSETRGDCTATIVGEVSSNLVISNVIKPIIYAKESGQVAIIQTGVVVVESK